MGWREGRNVTKSGPSSARHRSAIEMAFRWRADNGPSLNAGLIALRFLGNPDQYCQETIYFCDFSLGGGGGGGSGPPVLPPLDPPMMTTTRIQINLHKGQVDFVHILIWIYAANGHTVDRLLLHGNWVWPGKSQITDIRSTHGTLRKRHRTPTATTQLLLHGKWVWPGNAQITDCRPTHCTLRKKTQITDSHNTALVAWKVSMTRKCSNHRLQTNPLHLEEENTEHRQPQHSSCCMESGYDQEMLKSQTADQPTAPWGRNTEHRQPQHSSCCMESGYDQEMLKSQTADQPTALWGRDKEHRQTQHS